MGSDGGGSHGGDFGGGGGGFIGGYSDFGGGGDYSHYGSEEDNAKFRKRSVNFMIIVITLCFGGYAIFTIVWMFANETTKSFSISPKEQVLWCNGNKLTVERKTEDIKVFETTKDDIDLSDEVRSFSLLRSGNINANSYIYRSFHLTENSTVTIEKRVDFSAWLIIVKGTSNMENFKKDVPYSYDHKSYWDEDSFIFQTTECDEYFVIIDAPRYMYYSVEYFVELTAYDTSDLNRKCLTELTCKLNKKKKGDYCLLFDYNVSLSYGDESVRVKSKGIGTFSLTSIIMISVCFLVSLINIIVLIKFWKTAIKKSPEQTAMTGLTITSDSGVSSIATTTASTTTPLISNSHNDESDQSGLPSYSYVG